MAHDRRFRFAAQLSRAPDGTAAVVGRPGAPGRGPRLQRAAHARPLRRPAGAGAGPGGRGRRHHHAAPGRARLLQRLPPPLRAGQGGRHPRRAERGPLRAQPRRRLDADRLRRRRTRLRPPRRPGGPLRGGGQGRPGPPAHGRTLQLPRGVLRGAGAHAHAAAGAAAGPAADHRWWRPAGAVVRGAPRRHRQHQRQPARRGPGASRPRPTPRPSAPARRWPGSRRRRATASPTSS